jgi:hypothetical protein
MAWAEDEPRILTEMQARLAADAPRLARALRRPGPLRMLRWGPVEMRALGVFLLAAFTAGAAMLATGLVLHSPNLIAGGAICAGLSAPAPWYLLLTDAWRRPLRSS